MALTFHDGFETGGAEAWDSVTGSPTFVSGATHTGNYGLRCNGTGVGVVRVYKSDLSSANSGSVWIKFVAAPSINSRIIYMANGSYDHAIELTTNRKLTVDGSSEGSSVLSANTWYRISWYSTGADAIYVYLNNVAEVSDTGGGGGNTGNIIELGVSTSTATLDIYFDDCAIGDSDTTPEPDIRTLAARPVGEGTDQDTGTGSDWQDSDNTPAVYTEINQDPPNITDYNWAEVDQVMIRYTVNLDNCGSGNLSGIGGSDIIKAVNFMWYYATDGGGVNYNKITYDQSVRVETAIDDPVVPTWLSGYEADCPSDADAWTQTNFNAVEMGLSSDDRNKDLWFYEAYAMVAFEVIPPLATLGGSRILNATRVDQSGADDANVVDWDRADDFILAVNINSGGIDTNAAQYKLRWKNVSAGSFTDVGSTGEITYNATTDLVDGASIAVGGRKCDSVGGDTWQAGEENEGNNLCDSINLADEYETEIHFALDCSNAIQSAANEYEFELYDVTEGISRGTCGATIKMAWTPPVAGATRIANATRVDQSGADDVDVINWNKSNDFIVAVRIYTDYNTNVGVGWSLEWRNVTDAGSWTVLDSTGELTYNAITDLSHGNAVLIGERICDVETGYTWSDGKEVEGSNLTTPPLPLSAGYYMECQWAVDCANADDGDEYEFRIDVVGTILNTCLATITMAGATIPLDGTITATTAVSGDIEVDVEITGVCAAQSGVAGDIEVDVEIIGAIAAQSVVSGDIEVDVEITGVCAAQSGVAGDIEVDVTFTGTTNAQSAISGDIEVAKEITGTIAAQSAVSGDLSVAKKIDGTIAAQSIVDGNLSLKVDISGTITAQSGVSANLSVGIPLTGAIAAQSGVAGDIEVAKEITGSLTAQSVVAGDIEVDVEIIGAIAAQSGVSGDLSIGGAVPLAGTITATTAVSGDIKVDVEITGAIAAQSSISGDIEVDVEITGVCAAQSGVAGDIEVDVEIIGAIAAQSVVSGDIEVDVEITGVCAAQSGVSGDLTVTGGGAVPLTGIVNVQSNISGDIEVAKEVTGAITAQSNASGILSVTKNLTGIITATSGVSADLTTFAFLSGSIIANSTVSSPGLEVLKNLTGQIQASGSVAGNILVIKLLTGSVLVTSNIIGELSGTGVAEAEIDLPDDWMWIADMINEDGRDMLITVPGGPTDSNEPWRGNTPGIPVSAKGIFVGHVADQISGDHVKRQEQRLLVAPASNITISEGTKIVDSIDGSDWYVEKFKKITEETDILLYILEVRQ